MHVADLGVATYLLWNCMYEMLVELGGSYASPLRALGQILTMIQLIAKDLDAESPLFDLTIGMIIAGPNDAPKLKVKAGEARHLVPIMCCVLRTFFDTSSAHGKLRMYCANALRDCYREMDEWSDGSATRLGRFGRQFVLLYNDLHLERMMIDPWSMRWRLYPKHHMFIHICESGFPPKSTWTYWDESTIGECAQLCARCHPAKLAVTPISKHRHLEYGLLQAS